MRELFELMEAGVNLFGLEPAQAITTELLDVVGRHDRAVDDGAAQRCLVYLVGLRQVPHEAACEAVAGPCRIEDVFERIGRYGKVRVKREQSRPVLAAFYYEHLRPPAQYLPRRADQVRLA